MTDLFENSADAQQWRQAADYINCLLESPVTPATLNLVKEILNRDAVRQWNGNRFCYTYARMDAGGLIALASEKQSLWQQILNAKACFGPVADLRAIYQAGLDRGMKFDLNAALSLASTSISFCPGLKTSGCLETAEQLFQWGASAASWYNQHSGAGSYFFRAVDECGAEMGRIYARYGCPINIMTGSMQSAQSNGNASLHRKFRDIYWEYGRYTAADAETLVEKKDVDPSGNSRLRVIFNFASGRVSEVYEWEAAGRQPVVRDFAFDEYGPVAVEAARRKLEDLGGHPSDGMVQLRGKKSFDGPLKK